MSLRRFVPEGEVTLYKPVGCPECAGGARSKAGGPRNSRNSRSGRCPGGAESRSQGAGSCAGRHPRSHEACGPRGSSAIHSPAGWSCAARSNSAPTGSRGSEQTTRRSAASRRCAWRSGSSSPGAAIGTATADRESRPAADRESRPPARYFS